MLRWSFLLLMMCMLYMPLNAVEENGHEAEHHFHANEIGLFAGATTAFKKEIGGGTSFTLGLDYERRFTHKIGAMALIDLAEGDHKRKSLFAVMFAWRPISAWRIALGPAFELVDKDKPDGTVKESSHFVTAIRTIYEFHLGKFNLGPTLGIDLIGETDTNIVYGITIGKGF